MPRAVVTLGVILPEELPVAFQRFHLVVDGNHFFEWPVGESLVLPVHKIFQGIFRLVAQIDENETSPVIDVYAVEGVIGHPEVIGFDAYGRCDEFTGQRVGPCVLWADDTGVGEVAVLVRADDGAAVAAGVVKHTDDSVPITRNDQ